MRIRTNLLVVSAVLLSSYVTASHAATCTTAESIKVEKLVYGLHDWDGVYGAYRKFPECGTNNIVEVWGRYSEVIAGLLADHWERFDDLLKLASSHPEFEKFVLDHVADETLPAGTLQQIKTNAATKCPSGGGELCAKIEKAAQ
jgi:hypothetical protein